MRAAVRHVRSLICHLSAFVAHSTPRPRRGVRQADVAIAIVHVLLCAAGAWAGALAARRSLKLGAALSASALGVTGLRFGVTFVPALEPRVFPWDWYPFVEPWWFHPFVLFTVGAAAMAARASMVKRDLVLVAGGLFMIRVATMAWADAFPPELDRQGVCRQGVCRQTTMFTCGAAASATFLHVHGIEATEDEMARLCVTRCGYFGGTTEAGMMRGLRRKGLDVRIRRELVAPSIVSIRLSALVSHAIVLLELREDVAIVADPLRGRVQYKRTDFERAWLGSAIVRR